MSDEKKQQNPWFRSSQHPLWMLPPSLGFHMSLACVDLEDLVFMVTSIHSLWL